MSKKKTHEEYVIEVEKLNPNIKVIGHYINRDTKILHKCIICGYEWNVRPYAITYNKQGCPICNNLKRIKNRTKTNEQYINDVKKINPNIIVLEKYINATTKIKHQCLIDKYEWLAKPTNILSGKGCPLCGKTLKKTQKEYMEQVLAINPNISVVGKYINSNTKILHKCKKCGQEWNATPINILQGKGCPICAKKLIGDALRKPQSKYEDTLNQLHPNIELIETYKNMHTKILHKCKDCGNEWKISPSNIKKVLGCPKCNDGVSYPNKFIYNLLDQIKINYITEMSFDWSNGKRYDLYIPSFNCIIENHGEQHYKNSFAKIGGKTLDEEKENDIVKMKLALSNQIDHYIIIDCRKSEKLWIQKNIMLSILPHLMGFTEQDIDWNACDKFASSSFIMNIVDLWKQGLCVSDIANKLKVCKNTVQKYLKKAKSYGLCNYTSSESYKRGIKKISGINAPQALSVYCVELQLIYGCIRLASQETKVCANKISDCCRGKRKTSGGYHWYYLYDYIKKDGVIIQGAISLGLITEEKALKQLTK